MAEPDKASSVAKRGLQREQIKDDAFIAKSSSSSSVERPSTKKMRWRSRSDSNIACLLGDSFSMEIDPELSMEQGKPFGVAELQEAQEEHQPHQAVPSLSTAGLQETVFPQLAHPGPAMMMHSPHHYGEVSNLLPPPPLHFPPQSPIPQSWSPAPPPHSPRTANLLRQQAMYLPLHPRANEMTDVVQAPFVQPTQCNFDENLMLEAARAIRPPVSEVPFESKDSFDPEFLNDVLEALMTSKMNSSESTSGEAPTTWLQPNKSIEELRESFDYSNQVGSNAMAIPLTPCGPRPLTMTTVNFPTTPYQPQALGSAGTLGQSSSKSTEPSPKSDSETNPHKRYPTMKGDKARGNYKCQLCGLPKANHVCEYIAVIATSKFTQTSNHVLQDAERLIPFEGERIIVARRADP